MIELAGVYFKLLGLIEKEDICTTDKNTSSPRMFDNNIHTGIRNSYRCPHCRRLLFKARIVKDVEIKCPKCSKLVRI